MHGTITYYTKYIAYFLRIQEDITPTCVCLSLKSA